MAILSILWCINFNCNIGLIVVLFSVIFVVYFSFIYKEKKMEFRGSANRIQRCACELMSIGNDLMDDQESWDFVGRDLQLKVTFLYCDFDKVISVAPEEQKRSLTELANRLFCSIEEVIFFILFLSFF